MLGNGCGDKLLSVGKKGSRNVYDKKLYCDLFDLIHVYAGNKSVKDLVGQIAYVFRSDYGRICAACRKNKSNYHRKKIAFAVNEHFFHSAEIGFFTRVCHHHAPVRSVSCHYTAPFSSSSENCESAISW